MVIEQGDVFWIELSEPHGADPGYRRPYVVVQNNTFNFSRIDTVVVCGITSNLGRADAPGNVRVTIQPAPSRSMTGASHGLAESRRAE